MSSVLLQVGQCGNQLGSEFWKHVMKDESVYNGFPSLVYTNGDGKLRSVNIDTEPKVLAQMRRNFDQDIFREENIHVGHRGRGTNWALGYHGTSHHQEDKILEETMDTLRKEIERCPSFTGVVLLHSLSGGTGSGLGSHLCELIKEEYPMNYMMNCVVAPHLSGESPLQHYNTLLCLTWLQRHSDSIMLFHNDEILYRMESRSKRDPEDSGVSFKTMNRHIAACMAGVFLPTDSLATQSGCSIGLEPWEMLRSICPMPNLKYVHVNHHAKSKLSWESLAGHTLHTLQKYDDNHIPYKSLANLVVARGDSTGSFAAQQKTIESRVKSSYHCVDWNPFPVDFWTARNNSLGPKGSASLTIAANYSNVVDYLGHVTEKAREKFSAKAYLHWYLKHGCEMDIFEGAFEELKVSTEEYKAAVT